MLRKLLCILIDEASLSLLKLLWSLIVSSHYCFGSILELLYWLLVLRPPVHLLIELLPRSCLVLVISSSSIMLVVI